MLDTTRRFARFVVSQRHYKLYQSWTLNMFWPPKTLKLQPQVVQWANWAMSPITQWSFTGWLKRSRVSHKSADFPNPWWSREANIAVRSTSGWKDNGKRSLSSWENAVITYTFIQFYTCLYYYVYQHAATITITTMIQNLPHSSGETCGTQIFSGMDFPSEA